LLFFVRIACTCSRYCCWLARTCYCIVKCGLDNANSGQQIVQGGTEQLLCLVVAVAVAVVV
jgi:hypothetical protein